ncbi:MAG: hypothetical protein QXD23_03235 [Candidatus Micrarchaeaceae archaeon]
MSNLHKKSSDRKNETKTKTEIKNSIPNKCTHEVPKEQIEELLVVGIDLRKTKTEEVHEVPKEQLDELKSAFFFNLIKSIRE